MEDSYFPGQKIKLKVEGQVSKWEVLKVDNTIQMITCLKLNTLETKVESFAMERIPQLRIKKDVGLLGILLFGTFYWTCFLAIALEVYR